MPQTHSHPSHSRGFTFIPVNTIQIMEEKETKKLEKQIENLPLVLKQEFDERMSNIGYDREWFSYYMHDESQYFNPDRFKIRKALFDELSANFVWDFINYSKAEKGLTII